MRRLVVVLLAVSGLTLLARGVFPCEAMQGLQPRCYVSLHPGPTEDAVNLVRLSGAPTFAPTGQLRLTTVQVDPELDLVEWFRNASSERVGVVPRATVFPPGQDLETTRQENVVQMATSQLDATVAALSYLGYDVDTEFDGVEVHALSGYTAVEEGALVPGDVILDVDGAPVRRADDLVTQVQQRSPGDRIVLTVRRGGAEVEVEVDLVAAPDEPDTPHIGVLVSSYLELPVEVDIDAGVIGGPSAGLMFALAIVDLLEPDDLTGGAVIAGTGTISRDGRVGAIGGIRQKVVGALNPPEGEAPATVFLVPSGNLDVARSAPAGRDVLLVPVDDLAAAVDALRDLRAGRRPAGALAIGR